MPFPPIIVNNNIIDEKAKIINKVIMDIKLCSNFTNKEEQYTKWFNNL